MCIYVRECAYKYMRTWPCLDFVEHGVRGGCDNERCHAESVGECMLEDEVGVHPACRGGVDGRGGGLGEEGARPHGGVHLAQLSQQRERCRLQLLSQRQVHALRGEKRG